MGYIEIQDGICVNIDKIDAIEALDNSSCKVYIGKRVYLATFSYDNLITLLKNNDTINRVTSKEERNEKTMKKLDAVLSNAGYFAG